MADPSATTAHWNGAYAASSAAVVDIGGGTNCLVDGLIERGFEDRRVLDVSDAALVETQRRLAARAGRVPLPVRDMRDWRPHRTCGLWHDRAVVHFQANHADRDADLRALNDGTASGSVGVVGTFAPDGATSAQACACCATAPSSSRRRWAISGILSPLSTSSTPPLRAPCSRSVGRALRRNSRPTANEPGRSSPHVQSWVGVPLTW